MADIPRMQLVVTNIASSSGACRFQLMGGQDGTQWLIADLELTAAQNAALSTALAAVAATVTNFTFPAAAAPLPGVFNAV